MNSKFLDRKRCDMLTLNQEQEKELRSKMKSDQIASSCFGLIIGIVAVLFWMLIAGALWHFGVQAYKSHPYIVSGLIGGIGAAMLACLLWWSLSRLSRRTIRLPEHLTTIEQSEE
jgi:hypothetical protein